MNIDALEKLKTVATELLRETKKLKKLSEKAGNSELSPKQTSKAKSDADWQAMHVRKLEYKAHAAAVDAGIADVRDASEYEAITFNPDGWHEYPYTPDKPQCLNERVATSQLTYRQAKKAVELYESDWIGQDPTKLWAWATKEAEAI